MKLSPRSVVLSLLAVSSIIVLYYTILPYIQTYYPPPAENKGWRKDTRPDFIQSLGINPEKLDLWLELVYQPPINPNWMSTLLIKDGWIIREEYFDYAVRTRKLDLSSIGKTATLALFGIALDDAAKGSIDSSLKLDSPLYDPAWLPQGYPLSDPQKSEILFSHVLEHNSGLCPQTIGCDTVFENGEFEPAMDSDSGYVEWVVGHGPVLDQTKSLYYPPGHSEQFDGHWIWKAYSSVGYAHLGIVISNLYNQPASAILESRLLSPIGVTDFEYVSPLSAQDQWYSAGGLAVTPRDFARFAYLILKKGKWKNRQVIPESWIESLNQGDRYPNYSTNKDFNFGKRYPQDMIRLVGAGGTYAYIVPSMDLIALRTNKNGGPGQLEREAKFLSVLFDVIEN